MLIRLNDGLIVHIDQIQSASRCGNYTDLWIKDSMPSFKQIWDDDCRIWNALLENAR
jgi:hypothetical protein